MIHDLLFYYILPINHLSTLYIKLLSDYLHNIVTKLSALCYGRKKFSSKLNSYCSFS